MCLVLVSPCVAGQAMQALVLRLVTAAVEVWGFLVVIQPHPLALGGTVLPATSCWD